MISSTDSARILIQISRPELAEFFVEGGEPVEKPTLREPAEPDVEALVKLARKYDMEILGPFRRWWIHEPVVTVAFGSNPERLCRWRGDVVVRAGSSVRQSV